MEVSEDMEVVRNYVEGGVVALVISVGIGAVMEMSLEGIALMWYVVWVIVMLGRALRGDEV